MAKRTFNYLLPLYANSNHVEDLRGEIDHESRITFDDEQVRIVLSEVNSLVEEEYSLNLNTAQFLVESGATESKEAMIHNHPVGHKGKHIQFRFSAGSKVIRIRLDTLDDEDYTKCIRGFIHITGRILKLEEERYNLNEDLLSFFFNDRFGELEPDHIFLLSKIKQSSVSGGILNDADVSLEAAEIESLKSDPYLLPFLDWD